MAPRRMYNKAGLFVYDDKMDVLIQNIQCNRFGLKIFWWWWRKLHYQDVVLSHHGAGLGNLIIDFHATRVNELLDLIAADALKALPQILVQSL